MHHSQSSIRCWRARVRPSACPIRHLRIRVQIRGKLHQETSKHFSRSRNIADLDALARHQSFGPDFRLDDYPPIGLGHSKSASISLPLTGLEHISCVWWSMTKRKELPIEALACQISWMQDMVYE